MKQVKALEKDIARQRVLLLLKLAETVFLKDEKLAQRYVELAMSIAKRARIKIPLPYKMFICKKCKTFLWPGVNCRVRIRQNRFSHISITCLKCKHIMRRPLRLKEEYKLKMIKSAEKELSNSNKILKC